jgi:hypothetical protein
MPHRFPAFPFTYGLSGRFMCAADSVFLFVLFSKEKTINKRKRARNEIPSALLARSRRHPEIAREHAIDRREGAKRANRFRH